MKHRIHYWSCSKFADWLRGTKKPGAMTGSGWREWKNQTKKERPVRYWLAETGLGIAQDVVNWPTDQLYSIKYYVINRWVDQSHALVAHPKHIKPGSYADFDYRILYCLFDELVNFVEIEKAYSNFRWQEEKLKQLKWWQGGRWRTRTWRSAEAGIDHLKWEMTLTDEEWLDEGEKHKAKPTAQAETAAEILELYRWWTEVYPNRPCPMDASGWTDYCNDKRERGIHLLETDPEAGKWDTASMLKKSREIEEQQHEEETEMLTRLIKLRRSLWT